MSTDRLTERRKKIILLENHGVDAIEVIHITAKPSIKAEIRIIQWSDKALNGMFINNWI